MYKCIILTNFESSFVWNDEFWPNAISSMDEESVC
jgi:hypothetical protein